MRRLPPTHAASMLRGLLSLVGLLVPYFVWLWRAGRSGPLVDGAAGKAWRSLFWCQGAFVYGAAGLAAWSLQQPPTAGTWQAVAFAVVALTSTVAGIAGLALFFRGMFVALGVIAARERAAGLRAAQPWTSVGLCFVPVVGVLYVLHLPVEVDWRLRRLSSPCWERA